MCWSLVVSEMVVSMLMSSDRGDVKIFRVNFFEKTTVLFSSERPIYVVPLSTLQRLWGGGGG
jgi:hypothetical protein